MLEHIFSVLTLLSTDSVSVDNAIILCLLRNAYALSEHITGYCNELEISGFHVTNGVPFNISVSCIWR